MILGEKNRGENISKKKTKIGRIIERKNVKGYGDRDLVVLITTQEDTRMLSERGTKKKK